MPILNSLLTWYDQNARILPWRKPPPVYQPQEAYPIWLSEIMLQQTIVATVIPYFDNFMRLWPSAHDLANAPLDDILHAWAGLGYYQRARNLHKCAKIVQYGFPDNYHDLLKLPGIGPYTAASISAIAFQQKHLALDGNLKRVFSRLFASNDLAVIREHGLDLIDDKRAGDSTQALMDFANAICLPKHPACTSCPLQDNCLSLQQNQVNAYPTKKVKKPIPQLQAWVMLITNEHGNILIRKRENKGLLAGLWEFPSTTWQETLPPLQHITPALEWHNLNKSVLHKFTHLHLNLYMVIAKTTEPLEDLGIFVGINTLEQTYALPSLMRKILTMFRTIAITHL